MTAQPLLAIIPARAGSVGVTNKALRPVDGRPMILRTLEAVTASGVASRIVVTTDDPAVAGFCRIRGYEVIDRPKELAAPDVPLFPVAQHAARACDWTARDSLVAIFQPTCPLLRPETIVDVVTRFKAGGHQWAITGVTDPRIHWHGEEVVGARLNRQSLTEMRVESGAVQVMRASALLEPDWVNRRELLAIPARDGLDIDTYDDLMLARRVATLRHIHFVVGVGERMGTGHYHRSAALAEALAHHRITWEWSGTPPDWMRDAAPAAKEWNKTPDLMIFDRLTVPESDLLAARWAGARVVVLEDDNRPVVAHLNVNDMIDPADRRYAVLRPEFLSAPARDVTQVSNPPRVLVTLGGADPAGLTDWVVGIAESLGAEVHRTPGRLDAPGARGTMSEMMATSDLVVTGRGRTALEAAAMGVPCVAIAANDREARHTPPPGAICLGHHAIVTDDQLRGAIQRTLTDGPMRQELSDAGRAAIDGHGCERLARKIEEVLAD